MEISKGCKSPIRRLYNGIEYHVPCNQCTTCIIGRKAVWTGRALSEWHMAGGYGAFSTLTYAHETGQESREDLEPLLEVLRDLHQVRYLIAPDIGDQFGRFHWHMLVFGPECTPQLQTDVQEAWEYGFTRTDVLNRERIGYTVGYCTKKLSGLPTGRILCSQLFGKAHMVDRGREFAAQGRVIKRPPSAITFNGRKYPTGPLQRQWFIEGYGPLCRDHSAKPLTPVDKIETAARTRTLSQTIADEKQAQGRKGETFGKTSQTQANRRSAG